MAKKRKNKFASLIKFIIFCVITGLCVNIGYKEVSEYLYPKKYSEYVEKYASEYGISENLLYAVIRTESSFNPDAVSSAGARGLTQITEDTFEWLLTKTDDDYSFDDLFTPAISIKYGALFLSILQDEFAITDTVIAAYHAGMGNVSGWLENPEYSPDGQHLVTTPISDTNHYISKVSAAIDRYYDIYSE